MGESITEGTVLEIVKRKDVLNSWNNY